MFVFVSGHPLLDRLLRRPKRLGRLHGNHLGRDGGGGMLLPRRGRGLRSRVVVGRLVDSLCLGEMGCCFWMRGSRGSPFERGGDRE